MPNPKNVRTKGKSTTPRKKRMIIQLQELQYGYLEEMRKRTGLSAPGVISVAITEKAQREGLVK